MFYFYVLYSLRDNKLYKGYTADLSRRFLEHCWGGVRSTKNRRPLVLIYSEQFPTKKEAMEREKWSKTIDGGKALKKKLVELKVLDEELLLSKVEAG